MNRIHDSKFSKNKNHYVMLFIVQYAFLIWEHWIGKANVESHGHTVEVKLHIPASVGRQRYPDGVLWKSPGSRRRPLGARCRSQCYYRALLWVTVVATIAVSSYNSLSLVCVFCDRSDLVAATVMHREVTGCVFYLLFCKFFSWNLWNSSDNRQRLCSSG